MKKSRYTENQIMEILKKGESGVPVPDLCREFGMSSTSYYKWRAKFGGMDASMIKWLKELEAENQRLKKMYAESKMVLRFLRMRCRESTEAVSAARDGQKYSLQAVDINQSSLSPDAYL